LTDPATIDHSRGPSLASGELRAAVAMTEAIPGTRGSGVPGVAHGPRALPVRRAAHGWRAGSARLAGGHGWRAGKAAPSGLPVNKSQQVKKRRLERFFFTAGEKFTSREKFTGKPACNRGA